MSLFSIPYLLASMASAGAHQAPQTLNGTSADSEDGSSSPQMSISQMPQLALLDFIFPGFSMIADPVLRYLKIDLNLYLPLLILASASVFIWNYFSTYVWGQISRYFMSAVDIRTDDEIYNILMAWVANQRFSQGARRFVVNTNLNSRAWYLWRWDDDDDEDEEYSFDSDSQDVKMKEKALRYTPSFGSHYFWYRGRLLLFQRVARESNSFLYVSEREEISISCFGRNPWILKELLREARQHHSEKDKQKTLIYRGTTRSGSTEPTWQRCMARSSRPFSTVILNEQTKQDLIEDVRDYLCPATQRWYANRGIPYRRGYLLYGPPGTGKSSLSLALAGFFKMRIYIVSLSSITANEEALGTLFAELPRRCVVLLEDIDTAGLTHTREKVGGGDDEKKNNNDSSETMEPGQITPGNGNTNDNNNNNNNNSNNRLSLSGLLNILDGVASQEGRILIMTTNHLEKLDKALIRPGRVDMTVKFGLADEEIASSIFQAIFSHLEGDDDPEPVRQLESNPEAKEALESARAEKRAEDDARVRKLAQQFASKMPTHEFSPAEIQGYLMKNKRDAEAALAGVEEFIEKTRKDRKEKELKEAEERRKKAEEEEAEKKKKEQEKEDKKKAEEKDKKKEEDGEKEKDEKKQKKDEDDKGEVKAKKEKTDNIKAEKPSSSSKDDDSTTSSAGEEDQSKSTTKEDAAATESAIVAKAERKLEVKTDKMGSHTRNDSGYVTPASGDP